MPSKLSAIKRSILLCLFLSANFSLTQAQFTPGSLYNGIIPNVTPPSPEASSLGKYGDYPVSQYTGVPNISIPIYTIKTGNFELPVSMSYHAGGVKVDDVCSWVGTNWSLNAGGAITRTIVGMPDESVPYGFLYRNMAGNGLKTSYDLNDPYDYLFLRRVSENIMDGEPDIFYYNFGSFSGKFYFDQSGNFQCIPANSLKLVRCPLNNTLGYADKHWEIADPGGNVYWFGSSAGNGFEKTQVFKDNPSGNPPVTGWYLTKIVLANSADEITFDYDAKSEQYQLPSTQSIKVLTNVPYMDPTQSYWDGVLNTKKVWTDGAVSGGYANTLSVSGTSMLKKISWKSGYLTFGATLTRQDMMTAKMLETISLFDINGNPQKDFKLNYNFVKQRYFLTSVDARDASSVNPLTYSFVYLNPDQLPLRTSLGINSSCAQDHWGYYNGANTNLDLIPAFPAIEGVTSTSNREPNENYMAYGTLNKITYPTGGYTTFDYQSNRYLSTTSPGNVAPGGTIISSNITVKAADPQPSQYQRIQTFNVPFYQNSIPLTIQFNNYGKPVEKQQAWLPTLKLEKLVNGTYQQLNYWDAYDNFPTSGVQANQYGLVDFTINTMLALQPGDYKITSDLVCGSPNCGTPVVKPSVTAQFTYSKYDENTGQPGTPQELIGGGLRISKITSYNQDGSFAGGKKYVYAPGNMLIYPYYLHQYGEDVWKLTTCYQNPECYNYYVCPPVVFANYKEKTSTSQAILGFTQGAPVGYYSVQEFDVDKTGKEKGYTNYQFKFVPDVISTFQFDNSYWSDISILNTSFPTTNYDYKRGLLERKEEYKSNDDGSYTLLNSLVNNYEFNDNDLTKRFNSLKAIRVKRMHFVNYPCGNMYDGTMLPTGDIKADNGYAFYNLVTGWVQLTSTAQTAWDQSGANPSSVVTNYDYNNPQHLQVTKLTRTNSKNQTVVTEYKYPSDFVASPANVYNSMVDLNMISPVIEQKAYNSGVLMQDIKNNYDYFQNGTIIKPKSVQSSINGNSLEDRAYFNRYDVKGNLNEQQKASDVKEVYLWGYNYQYPVAKITGADYATVETLLGGATAVSNFSSSIPTDQSVNSFLAQLRTGLPKALVTTFTYKPLVGMTSQTDPRGKTSTFEYDNFNRLKLIRDQDSKIVKQFEYQYQYQQ